jgi:hypothetical protein
MKIFSSKYKKNILMYNNYNNNNNNNNNNYNNNNYSYNHYKLITKLFNLM